MAAVTEPAAPSNQTNKTKNIQIVFPQRALAFRACGKIDVLKGHDFSRAINAATTASHQAANLLTRYGR